MVKLSVVLVAVLVSLLVVQTVGRQPRFAGEIERRAVDSHGHEEEEEDSHAHEEDSHADEECTISKSGLLEAFNEVAVELNVTGEDGHICSLPVPECDHHDDEEHHEEEEEDHHDDEEHHEEEEGHHDDEEHHEEDKANGDGSGSGNATDSMCLSVYDVCLDLIIHSGLASSACLSRECLEDEHSSSSDRPSSAEAYGLGFLMVILVSLGSLLGVTVVPLIYAKDKSKTKALVYKYMYFFMIALGTSALLCDAILHLFPHAWELHAHDDEEGDGHGHAHSEDGGGHKGVEEFVWKGTIAVLAIYLFYLLEFILHGFTSHTHSHGFPTNVEKDCKTEKECMQLDPTVPHGECSGTTENAGIVHPATSPHEIGGSGSHSPSQEALVKKNINPSSEEKEAGQRRKGVVGWILAIKPLAWLIIIGDGLHNFADGLALGAAISQSLTLGVSTTIALILHEIPHEFGDYVILLSTGLSWYSALLFNFVSALTAVLGFFVGVAAGTESEEANSWILAFAAGLFIYIALVDLLPELIHTKEKGGHRWGLFLVANLGFLLSFLALFLLAVYEEDLNNIL